MISRSLRLFVLFVVLAAAIAGCGGGGSGSGASSSTGASGGGPVESAPEPAEKKAEPAAGKPSPLDPLAALLEEGGFQGATPVPGGANHIASALSVQPAQGGNLINAYYYDDPKFAKEEDERIEGFFASHTRYGLVHSHGHYLVSTVSEAELTPVEKKNFAIVVREARAAEAAE